jgi:hypothetical protein
VALLVSTSAPLTLRAQKHATPAPLLAVEWGSSIDSVLARATRAGWEFLRVDEDSDFVFHTLLDGVRATVYAGFSARGLVRLEVGVQPHESTSATYRTLTDTLSRYFGAPALTTGDEGMLRPAPRMISASAWPGVLLGLRRDGWISVIFMCPETAPLLPTIGLKGVLRRTSG